MKTLLEVFEKWRVLLDKRSTEFHILAGILMLFSFIFVVADWIIQKNPYAIVLAGPKGSGKTMLYNQLKYVTSHVGTVKPNGDTFMLNTSKGKKKIVDVPRREVDKYLHVAAGIVFVVDSTAFLPYCAAISEYLYELLTRPSVLQKRIPVLILFNKMDDRTAHSMDFTRRQIERELKCEKSGEEMIGFRFCAWTQYDRILVSREVGGQASIDYKAFNFSQCLNKVKLAESSGLEGEIFELEKFIREC